LTVNNFKKNELHKPIEVLSVSAAIAAVYAIIQSFGEKIGFYLLPFLSYTKILLLIRLGRPTAC